MIFQGVGVVSYLVIGANHTLFLKARADRMRTRLGKTSISRVFLFEGWKIIQ